MDWIFQQYNNTTMETTTTTTTACHGGGGGGGSDDPDPLLLHLPEEVLIQILERLPVVSLLRFKSVCKSWLALIQTSYFIHLHINTFNSSSSSNFGSFILRTDNISSENEILMLSECEGSEYELGSENGDWYRCTDGSWHKFSTTTGTDDDNNDGSRHKFSDGGDWHWDNTNCAWYRFAGGHWRRGFWHWDNAYCCWFWGCWYWATDNGTGNWHWDKDNTNCGWYWVSDGRDWLWDDTNGRWYWDGDDDQDEMFKVDDDDDQLLLKVDNLELPSGYKLTNRKVIVGTCNGLICLRDTELGDVSLWNPATRQFRTLPKSITTIEIDDDSIQDGADFVAFGFDVKTKDYKVLLITNYFTPYTRSPTCPQKCFCRVQVYNLSTDSWRLINSTLALPDEIFHGLYLNGSCFFLARVYHPESNTYNRLINSFDFTKEIFTTIKLPPVHHHRQHLYLRCLGGGEKMALFTTLRKTPSGEYEGHYYYVDGYEDCDMWVLNEHGCAMSKESWTKLHSFQIKNCIGGKPIGLSNNGKFAFLEATEASYTSTRRIQLYNLVTKEVKLDIPFCVSMSKVYVYKPSLVSILG